MCYAEDNNSLGKGVNSSSGSPSNATLDTHAHMHTQSCARELL